MKKFPNLKWMKLRATARRVSADDYEPEIPSMRLSSAFVVVMLLHVVAIGGIWAFNRVKERRGPIIEPRKSEQVSAVSSRNIVPAASQPTPAAIKASNSVQTDVAPVKKVERKEPVPKSAMTKVATPASVKDSGEIYTVVKGDNPVTIARHLKVNYQALLDLNKIDDPRKLRIGQKLHIPKE